MKQSSMNNFISQSARHRRLDFDTHKNEKCTSIEDKPNGSMEPGKYDFVTQRSRQIHKKSMKSLSDKALDKNGFTVSKEKKANSSQDLFDADVSNDKDDWRNYSFENDSSKGSISPWKTINETELDVLKTPEKSPKKSKMSPEKSSDESPCEKSKSRVSKRHDFNTMLLKRFEKIRKSKALALVQQESLEHVENSLSICQEAYIQQLETVMIAFNRFPSDLIEKHSGFELGTYSKLKSLVKDLKKMINEKTTAFKRMRSRRETAERESGLAKEAILDSSDSGVLRKEINKFADRTICDKLKNKEDSRSQRNKDYESDNIDIPANHSICDDEDLDDFDLDSSQIKNPTLTSKTLIQKEQQLMTNFNNQSNDNPAVSFSKTNKFTFKSPVGSKINSNLNPGVKQSSFSFKQPSTLTNQLSNNPVDNICINSDRVSNSFTNKLLKNELKCDSIASRNNLDNNSALTFQTKGSLFEPVDNRREIENTDDNENGKKITAITNIESSFLDFSFPEQSSDVNRSIQNNFVDNLNDSTARPKGKFVFKKPSMSGSSSPNVELTTSTPFKSGTNKSSMMDRLKSASETLKPLPTPEPIKTVSLNNSSVNFQSPSSNLFSSTVNSISSRSNNTNIPPSSFNETPAIDSSSDSCQIVENQYEYNFQDFQNDIDPNDTDCMIENDYVDDNPTKPVQTVNVDDDGWPIYNPEDFEDLNAQPSTNSSYTENNTTALVSAQQPKYEGMGNFHSGTKNDGITGEFDGLNFPHSSIMMEQLKEKFGLKSFRPNQLQVINATLLGYDCFVLMPTGGGKSLCYQLPAILRPGITVVISPLKSLILDQCNKLDSLDIPVAHLSGNVSLSRSDEIYHMLSVREPLIKLLYATPEKISASPKFQSTLDTLYSRGKLACFVIDEAHCVSQWGHDFRPDYKKLSILKSKFPQSTLIALTATAAPRVRADILHQLGVPSCKWFLSSFNRPNLAYSVLPKKPKIVVKDIEEIIKKQFRGQSGIVYCLSRSECDKTAETLSSLGISAKSYHAGLPDKEREIVQNGWMTDKFKVVCATIAFGMGVDKLDVRFVIHHSLPKSVEGYYQEAGRAGRDGEPASCIVFYSYSDVTRYRKLLQMDRNANPEAKRVHIENLMRMVEFCENPTDCRRALVLAYLGEMFTRDQCLQRRDTACDNCLKKQQFKVVDVTEDCTLIVRCVREVGSRFTLLHMADAFKGSSHQRISSLQSNPIHGRGKSWPRGDPLRLLTLMVTKGFLSEELVVSNDIAYAYLKLGPSVHKLMNGEVKVAFSMTYEVRKDSLKVQTGAVKPTETELDKELKQISSRCHADLVEACRELAEVRGAAVSAVMQPAALRELAARLPETEADMLKVPHVTKANYQKFGSKLLQITSSYAAEKLGLLMQHQDELDAGPSVRSNNDGGWDADTDWAAEAQKASLSDSRSSWPKQPYKRKGAKTKGGPKKRFKRSRAKSGNRTTKARTNKTTAAKPRTRTAKASTSSGNSSGLGSMPIPQAKRPNTNPRSNVFPPSKYSFM